MIHLAKMESVDQVVGVEFSEIAIKNFFVNNSIEFEVENFFFKHRSGTTDHVKRFQGKNREKIDFAQKLILWQRTSCGFDPRHDSLSQNGICSNEVVRLLSSVR